MKKDSRKEQVIKKALDALKKQALKDQELKKIKGGDLWGPLDGGITLGMFPPPIDLPFP